MVEVKSQLTGQCECGDVQFHVDSDTLFRVICHCTICQEFNHAAFADISVFRAKDVQLPESYLVEYKTHKPSPAAVQRGKCIACNKPAIELLNLPLLPKLVIIPSSNFKNIELIPRPKFHVFYDKRLTDSADSLPKYNGFIASQTTFLKHLIVSFIKK